MSYYRKSLVGNTTRVIRHDGVKAVVKYFEEVRSRDLVFTKESVTVYNMTLGETLMAFNLPEIRRRNVVADHIASLLPTRSIDEILQSWN